MKPNAREITIAILESLKTSSKAVNFESEIIHVLCVNYGLSPSVAAEHAERTSSAVERRLKDVYWHQRERGITPEFEISAYDRRVLVPIQTSQPGHRDRRSKILSLLRSCSWTNFERACCKLLELSDCTRFDVGRGTKEGGLDFYAIAHLGRLAPEKKMLFDWRVRVFGQAKQWSGKVGEKEVRTFHDQLHEFASRHEGTAYKKAPEWFRSDPSPILGVIVGLAGFTKGASEVARRRGILTRDGEQLADFFADAVARDQIEQKVLEILLK